MKRWGVGLIVVTVFFQTFVTIGFAEEPRSWKFMIAPYGWFNGLEGDLTVEGNEVDFGKEASDMFEALEFGASLIGEVQYNRFILRGEVDYCSRSTDELNSEDQPGNATMDVGFTLYEISAGYQFDGWADNQTITLLVCVRHLNIESELKVYGPGDFSTSKVIDLTDPLFMIRPSLPVFPSKIDGLFLRPTIAVGCGGDSDLVYELFPEFDYVFNDRINGRIGYRTVGYKFKDGDNELNVRFTGPVAGIAIKF